MIKTCQYRKDNKRCEVCNLLPIWFQTSGREVISSTLPLLKEKMAKKKIDLPIDRCEILFPVNCTYEATRVK